MMNILPSWVTLLFVVTVLLTIILFYYSNGKQEKLAYYLVAWSIIHSLLAYFGFYQDEAAIPPRFGLVIVPVLIALIYSFTPRKREYFYERRSTQVSTFLHAVRVPIEIILLMLYRHEMIPELMTFEGRNFDIIIGLSAPLIGLLNFYRKLSKKVLLVWNFLGLFFVTFILVNGILSAELPFQQFGFDQPNRAVIFFPFILLPATIVPIVIHTHLIDIGKLIRDIRKE